MRTILIALACLVSQIAVSQRTSVYTDNASGYMSGRSYFDADVYGASIQSFDDFEKHHLPVYEPNVELLKSHADFAKAQAAIRMDLPEAEMLVLNFIEEHESEPVASQAALEIAHFYFADRDYDKAIEYYNMTSASDLDESERQQVLFRLGYAYFAKQEFDKAERLLAKVSNNPQGEYYYPANYYVGMCKFIEGDFANAVERFKKVGDSEEYHKYVPYYTSLLYFAMHDFENVIAHGEPELETKRLYNESEIRHMVGQSYFELKDYKKALPYLVAFEQQSNKMRPGEFYQLAYAHYQLDNCDESTAAFKEIASLQNPMGQRANFYIADCNLKNGNLREARNAFKSVSRMDYDPELQEEALFNFGKLSAQLDYDKDAIHTLDGIASSSPYYPEAQTILDDIFAYTSDYSNALATLSEMESLSPKLQGAYQRLSFTHGVQLMSDDNLSAASEAFSQSLKYPVDPAIEAQSTYWVAEISYVLGDKSKSQEYYDRFLLKAGTIDDLPVECDVTMANYSQGYNYFRQGKYSTALDYFDKAIAGMISSRRHQDPRFTKQILPDAFVRSGDCSFKLNNYQRALSNYDEAIAIANTGAVYAKFQKAMVLGLMDKPFDKIVLLEEIAADHSNSQFADDALFQLATTYQEMQSTDKALPALRNLVTYHPSSELRNMALLRMGLISYNNGDFSSAIEFYQSVFENNPTSREAQEALTALEEIYVSDLSSPEEYFAFTETVPGYEISTFRKDSMSFRAAEIQFENAVYELAIKEFGEYLDEFPNGINSLAAHYYRGESYAILEQYDNSLMDYDHVVQRGNSSFYQKALTKAASISYHHSESFLTSYDYYSDLSKIAVDPEVKYDAQLGMMRSAYRSELWDKARISGLTVLQNSTSTTDEQAEAHYCVGKASYVSKDLDQALTQFNEVIKKSNNVLTAEARYLVCEIYYQRQQFDIAEQLCFNSNKENTNYPHWIGKGLILLSDVYVAKEDFFNAKAPLEAIIENFQGATEIVAEARTKLDALALLEQENSRLKADTGSIEIDEQNEDEK